MDQWLSLARVFAYLSIQTVGGGLAAFPELKSLTVEVHHWLTLPELVHLYGLSQMSPGPNMMMIVPIGDRVGGPVGALVVLVAFFGPTSLLTLFIGRIWRRLEGWRWRASIQGGLAPVSIGLLSSGCFSLAKGAIFGLETAAIAAVVLLILLRYKINPALLVLAGAFVGVLAFRGS